MELRQSSLSMNAETDIDQPSLLLTSLGTYSHLVVRQGI
jgi:hypothetical protein